MQEGYVVVRELPVWPADQIPAITTEQMREVDRLMIDRARIGLVQMLENAGRNLADLAIHRFASRRVVVLVGPGGNGGGGLVAVRHLANRGVTVHVACSTGDADLTVAARLQLDIVRRMGVPVADEPGPADLVVDALIGYSLCGDPGGLTAALIRWANEQVTPRLALDVPSGLDATTGSAASPCVQATATLTLALPKIGLIDAPEVGELYLGDISVPARIYKDLGLDVPAVFARDTLVRIQ